MRNALRLCALAVLAAGPAAAQTALLPPPTLGPSPGFQQQMDLQLRLNALQAQQDMAAQQAVRSETQMMNLEAQLRAQQAYATVEAQSRTPRLPPPFAGAPPPQIDLSQLASIPDAALAASNARVRAAASNRH